MPADAHTFTIAVAGGSGSGKTTLARAVVAHLGEDRCIALEHDSYYRDLAHLPPAERARANFDHPDSLESALLAAQLAALRAGKPVVRPRYDFATHTRESAGQTVTPRPFVICDGILLLAAPELATSFDRRVFLDAPADVRVLRRLERDVAERGRTVRSVIEQYMATVRPMHEQFVEPAKATADLVLDWRASIAAMVTEVVAGLPGER